jgi:hypothetical protein
MQKDQSFCIARISARYALRAPLVSTLQPSAVAFQHVATGFAFGDLSAIEVFVGVVRDQLFREPL